MVLADRLALPQRKREGQTSFETNNIPPNSQTYIFLPNIFLPSIPFLGEDMRTTLQTHRYGRNFPTAITQSETAGSLIV